MAHRAFHDPHITMPHGAGGHATRRLVEGLFAPAFRNPSLDKASDSGEVGSPDDRLVMTTDSYVVRPAIFPGGCLGELAVNGTINDLAVSGAEPIALSAAFILEAGLRSVDLRHHVDAMARAAHAAGVHIVTGDTKVVEHGKADGLFITTAGVGRVDPRASLDPARLAPGDAIILSGPIADHGITILLARGELEIDADLRSDTRSVLTLTRALLDACGPNLKWMRDATRGGVATVLNELAESSGRAVVVHEEAIPVRDEVRGACELLGNDPLHVANEGQFIAVVASHAAEDALRALHSTPGPHGGGSLARRIGDIHDGPQGRVLGKNAFGGSRVIEMLVGDPLPRIC